MALISVVIPTCNRASMLKRALDSVLKQTFDDIEIFVVDDASSDNTPEVIKNYLNDRVHYIRLDESKGANFARNLAVSKTQGQYIAFLDDDDVWMPEKLRKQMMVFEADSSIGLVYTGVEVIHTGYSNIYHTSPKLRGNLSKSILTFNYIGSTSSVMVKRAVFERAGGFDINLPQLQDYDLWIRICQISNIGYVSASLIKYYVHNNVSQITTSVAKNKKAIEIIDAKYSELISNLSIKEQRMRFCQRYNAMGKRELKNNQRKKSRTYFISSFKSYPNMLSIILYTASFFDYKLLLKIKSRSF